MQKAVIPPELELTDWTQPLPEFARRGAVTIGNFDGAHRGHAALLRELRERTQAIGGPAIALTFDPHPSALLRPDQAPVALATPADRHRLLLQLGADRVLTLRTVPDLLALTAREFFQRIVCDGLEARVLVEGPNFGFGRRREGDVRLLGELCRGAGIALSIVPPVEVDGAEVSSTRIRTELERGDVSRAAMLLGRPYRVSGVVGHGRQRGRTIGFPTANLEQVTTLVPRDGVYAVRAHTVDGRDWPAAANVGPNPTFAETERKIEVHLIGYSGDLYGQTLCVDFLRRLRDTRPFASREDLIAQLALDVAQAGQDA